MTETSVYVEDVSKLKDADELKQAYIGLKDTNRYFVTDSVFTSIGVEFTLFLMWLHQLSFIQISYFTRVLVAI